MKFAYNVSIGGHPVEGLSYNSDLVRDILWKLIKERGISYGM